MHRLRTADHLAQAGQWTKAAALLEDMARAFPDSVLVQQRLRDAYERLDLPADRERAAAAAMALRARRQQRYPILRSNEPKAAAGVLIIDPIFRGSRLYYSAMIAEALGGALSGGIDLLTREHVKSALLASYADRLAAVSLRATLAVPSTLWYGAVPAPACRQIIDRLALARPGTVAVAAGWNELEAHLPAELAQLRRRLPLHFFAYEYAAETLLAPAKQQLLAQVAAQFASFTLWVLNEGFDTSAVRVPGLRLHALPDPIPHHEGSALLLTAREQRSKLVVDAIPPGCLGLLAVGLQSARKGLRDLIRAARTLKSDSLPARIVLSGEIAKGEEQLNAQVAKLAPTMVARSAYVDDAEILRTYNAADVVLLPYARDFSGSSGVFAHAMAFGKPVIATDHGCVGWRVKRFGLGLVYPADDPAALVAAIRSLLAWTAEQWQACRERCRAYHAANDYARTLVAIRAEVIAAVTPPTPSAPASAPANPSRPTAPVESCTMDLQHMTADAYSFELDSVETIRQVCLLDTGIGSRNMGDHIIVDSIRRHLREIFPDAIFVTVPTHEYLGPESLRLMDSSEVRLVCGTNLLASHMDQYKQWKLGSLEMAAVRDLTLLGCGWWQYQDAPNAYTELLLNRILSAKTIHSVRDSYTLAKLRALNGKSVVNTTCPTLWSLTPAHLKGIPDRMARDVVTTLTDYKADPVADRFMLDHLALRYRTVYVWVQGTGDFSYLKRLWSGGKGDLRVVPATLEAFDRLLTSSHELDYVGTRLHAGVRALQKKRRALILAVDNRAREISADTSLPCIPREHAHKDLEGLVDRFSARDIRLPVAGINRFIGQFAKSAR